MIVSLPALMSTGHAWMTDGNMRTDSEQSTNGKDGAVHGRVTNQQERKTKQKIAIRDGLANKEMTNQA